MRSDEKPLGTLISPNTAGMLIAVWILYLVPGGLVLFKIVKRRLLEQ